MEFSLTQPFLGVVVEGSLVEGDSVSETVGEVDSEFVGVVSDSEEEKRYVPLNSFILAVPVLQSYMTESGLTKAGA